jgi:hypothetical protein
MITILTKKIFFLFLLIILTLVYSTNYYLMNENTNIYSQEININKPIEHINNLTINDKNVCNSSIGVCPPPPGWQVN